MTKVIVEIDGKRHRLVKDKKDIDCSKDCSLRDYCYAQPDAICNVFDSGYHFEKDEPKVEIKREKDKSYYKRGC